LLSVCLGNLVEFYDFAAFGGSAAVLALVLTSGQGALTSVFAVLAAALLIRPVGAVVVGRFSDQRGRRAPFLVMTLLTCSATATVGLLPSAASAGFFAALALLLVRSVQAFCTGGEISTSVPYLIEIGPAERRGLLGGFHLASAAAGMALGLAAVMVVQVALPPAEYLTWGWRVPFLVAVPLALAVAGLRRHLDESREFRAAAVVGPREERDRSGEPVGLSAAAALIRLRPRTVVSGLLLAGAFSATVNLWFVFIPAYLLASNHATAATALGPAAVGLLACAVLAPLAGALSDRLGRRVVLMAACAALCVLWPTAFPHVLSGDGWVAFALGSLTVGAVLSGFVLGSHLPEAFAVEERALGVGLTYGIGSAVFGGLAPLLAERLVTNHHPGVVVVYPVACAVLAAASLAWAGRRPHLFGSTLAAPQHAGTDGAAGGG
jgi:MHS family proline/betaine transporter-like MFS transporter